MIKLPKGINYAEVYFTFRCNMNCSYCINGMSSAKRKGEEMPAKEFSEYLNNVDWGDIPLTIGGGEPTVRDDFFEFINNILEGVNLNLLTNLKFDVYEFLDNVSPGRFCYKGASEAYKSIRVSYHPKQMDPNTLVAKAYKLQESGFSIGIFGLSHPQNLKYNVEMSEICRKKGVYFFIKDFLGVYNGRSFGYLKYPEAVSGENKKVACRTKELLISPRGGIYKCHRDLYCRENEITHISKLESDIEKLYKFTLCSNFGSCNYCDAKEKTNRFLEDGNCNMEIHSVTEDNFLRPYTCNA